MKQRKPQAFNTDHVAHTAECAFQRAIIQRKYSVVKREKIKWIDIELPVNDSASSRGQCVDLIGKDTNGNYVLCELKFRKKSDNGNPIEATEQLKGYYEEIQKNKTELNRIGLGHINATETIDWVKVASSNTRLMVVANCFYWDTWLKRSKNKVTLTDGKTEYYSVNIDRNVFEKQKGENKYYTPKMPEEGLKWNEIKKTEKPNYEQASNHILTN